MVKAKLLLGTRKSAKVAENLRRLEQFFQPFKSLPFDDDAAIQYGQLRAALESDGCPVGANDRRIAATALTHN